MYKIIKALADLRAQYKALRRGPIDVLYDNPTAPGALVYRRQADGDTVLVFMNTSDNATLVANAASGLPAGTVLENLLTEPPGFPLDVPKVGADGGVTLSLMPRGVIVAHATSQVVAPTAPGATITVTTALEGQTFSADTVITGTISPATAKLKMVANGDLDAAKNVTVQGDGTWSITLPVSTFSVGSRPLTLAFYSPEANVSTRTYHLTTNVVFMGNTISVDDPAGDDHGPTGFHYTYPKDSSFTHQQDLTNVTALVGATTMKLQLTMANVSTVWTPPLGFDHVVFNIFFQVPGQTGLTTLPLLSATTPAGFGWTYGQFTSGYTSDNKLFNSTGADAMNVGQLMAAPVVSTSGNTITIEYDRTRFLSPTIASWTGVKVYVTTWDYDGVQKIFRPISAAGAAYEYGNGNATDPHIMDDVPPITLTGP
jgi:hypothetical protein